MKTKCLQYTKEAQERDPDFLGGLIVDVVPKDSCLVFCATKKNCENVAMLLADVLQGYILFITVQINLFFPFKNKFY